MKNGNFLDVELVDETYYTKSDIHKRYPRTDTRLRLDFQYNPHVNEALKNELRQLEGFYNCKFDNGFWSVRYERVIVDTTIAIFNRFEYNTSVLETYSADAPMPQAPRATEATAAIMGDALALDWPFIEDIEMRDKIREIVKGVPNRKWDGDKKKWLIPMKQAGFLQKRLENLYPPLANAIGAVDEVQSYIENHAERISISAATSLTNEETIHEMKTRMDAIFNDDVELFPFQYVGVRFAEIAGGRCLIGDDMGIGKTMQAIAYAALHEELWPVLIVCPASVKYNWESEIVKWIANPSLQVVTGWEGELEETDFTIVNYDLMAKREEQLLSMGFKLCIFDESHYLKNRQAKRTKASLHIGKQADSVLCLSGTAITSRPEEYFTTLNLLRPIDFPSWLKYVQRYCDAYHNGYGWDTRGSSNTDELHAITRDFVIRRLKKEVMEELPDKMRQEFTIEPSVGGMKSYKDLQNSWSDEYRIHKENNTLPAGFVLNMLTDLRHHCGRLKVSSAVDWIHQYTHTTGKPVVVYTHHNDVMDAVCELLKRPLIVKKISGSISALKRQETIESFQREEIDVLVCNILAANVGITLTAADTVLFVEREWVPATEEQAEDRVNRIGQDSQYVHAVYLRVSNTIDERFAHIVAQKREVVKGVLDGGEGEQRHKIARELLMQMIDAGEMPSSMLSDFGMK